MKLTPRQIKVLERIAYCGDGYHKVINLSLHTFPMGTLDPDTAWKLSWDERCTICRERMDAAKKAYLAGLRAGKR